MKFVQLSLSQRSPQSLRERGSRCDRLSRRLWGVRPLVALLAIGIAQGALGFTLTGLTGTHVWDSPRGHNWLTVTQYEPRYLSSSSPEAASFAQTLRNAYPNATVSNGGNTEGNMVIGSYSSSQFIIGWDENGDLPWYLANIEWHATLGGITPSLPANRFYRRTYTYGSNPEEGGEHLYHPLVEPEKRTANAYALDMLMLTGGNRRAPLQSYHTFLVDEETGPFGPLYIFHDGVAFDWSVFEDVPEPSGLLILALGSAAFVRCRRR